jgi:2-polyprenyl-3-methyl-5-hydroxy-6-metoxy-1,4-benzoquinol methylase
MNDMTASNEWDDFASGWDSNDDARIYAQRAFASWTKKVAPLIFNLPGSRVLDFGCGTGLLSEKLATVCHQIVAVDTSTAMIEVLRGKIRDSEISNVTTLSTAVSAATIGESAELHNKFDMIVASSVCSFLPDYETTLGDLSSLLKPGGYFIQWDWLADMSVTRIQNAFDASGLVGHNIDEGFVMNSDKKSMPVVMGIGRLPTDL